LPAFGRPFARVPRAIRARAAGAPVRAITKFQPRFAAGRAPELFFLKKKSVLRFFPGIKNKFKIPGLRYQPEKINRAAAILEACFLANIAKIPQNAPAGNFKKIFRTP